MKKQTEAKLFYRTITNAQSSWNTNTRQSPGTVLDPCQEKDIVSFFDNNSNNNSYNKKQCLSSIIIVIIIVIIKKQYLVSHIKMATIGTILVKMH